MFTPQVKAALPLDKTKELFNQMHTQLGILNQTTFTKYFATAGIYKAEYDRLTMLINLSLNKLNQIDGLYFNEYKPEKPVDSQPAAATVAQVIDPSLTESPVTLKTLGGIISGTLTMPKDAAPKIPVVLIIAGSGYRQMPTARLASIPMLLNTWPRGWKRRVLQAYDMISAVLAKALHRLRSLTLNLPTLLMTPVPWWRC